jgi:cell division protein FtsZ
MEFVKTSEASIIKVIGVGGGGSNAVNHMFRQGIKGVEFIVCNTDSQALEISPVPMKIQLGASLTEGRGAGSIPEVGKNAAIENLDEMKKILGENTKMVFITAGMGGGTGTGAAPIIAQAAKELGILTVGIVTIPFLFEGKKRKVQADNGVEELKKNVDTLLIISNDKVREMYGNLNLSSAFGHADDILTIAAKGIAEIITVTGYINVDFEDVKTVMTNSGRAIMGSAKAKGDDRAIRAVEQALASPLLNDSNIKGARYILMNIASGTHEVTMDEIGSITDYIQDAAGLTADIIWGNCHDENLEDNVSVTIIATGFKTKQEQGEAEKSKPNIHVLTDTKKEAVAEITSSSKKEKEILEPQILKSDEPTLKPSPLTNAEREITFVFDIDDKASDVIETPIAEEKPEATKKHALTTDDEKEEGMMDEQFKKSRERIEKLKAMNYRFNNTNNVNDLEKEPAYKRRNVKLDNVAHSSESSVSRFTLSNEDEKKTELKQNNSFLHDSVD